MKDEVPPHRAAWIERVNIAQGHLSRACQAYAEQRAFRGDHRFQRELMGLCLAYGEALNTRAA